MKEKNRQKRRFSLSRLLFAMLFFSSLTSIYTVAKYVLTRHVAFAITVDKNLLHGYVEKGLVWDLNEGKTSHGLNNKGYTITLMADGTEGTLSGTGSGTELTTNMEADTLSHRTGYVTAEGTAVETVVPCSAYGDSGHSITAAIVADTEKGEIYTYIDNRLVQVYTLEDGVVPALTQLTEFAGQNLCSARIYNRILTQAELSQNYYMDLLNYGDYVGQELPEFIQKSSLLRADSLYDWEDAGARSAGKTERGNLSIEDSDYRGIRVATASDAVMDYELNSDIEDKTENGYTVRYIISVNSGGTAEKLFTSGGQDANIEASIHDMDFTYKFAGKSGSISCGNEGKAAVDLTVDEHGKMTVYKNAESVDAFLNADTGILLTDSFSIRPSAMMDTDGELGAFYKVEVYDRALSPIELQYLYIRDEEAYHIGAREPLSFEVNLPDDELTDGDWITFEAGDSPSWEEEDEYEFSHWFCKEYNVELYDEDLWELSDAMEADGFHKVHIRPVYIPKEEPETVPEETEMAEGDGAVTEDSAPESGGTSGTESSAPESNSPENGETSGTESGTPESGETSGTESSAPESEETSGTESSAPETGETSGTESSAPESSAPETGETSGTESSAPESEETSGTESSTPESGETTGTVTEDKETGSAAAKPDEENTSSEPPKSESKEPDSDKGTESSNSAEAGGSSDNGGTATEAGSSSEGTSNDTDSGDKDSGSTSDSSGSDSAETDKGTSNDE